MTYFTWNKKILLAIKDKVDLILNQIAIYSFLYKNYES